MTGKPKPMAPVFPFMCHLRMTSRNVPQVKSMLGSYGRYAEFIFELTGSTVFRLFPPIKLTFSLSHGKDYKHGEDGLTKACNAGVFFRRAICSRKRHVETSRREEEMGPVKGSGEGAGREKRKPPPSPLSFLRPRTYPKGYYSYSPQSSTVIKSKMAATTITNTNKVSPTQNTPALQASLTRVTAVSGAFYLIVV